MINNIINNFVISDHHFFHKNIIKYCNRPFNSVDEMNNFMIKKWNEVVDINSIVLHLGDFSFGNKKIIKSILDKLNGKIYLIKGNHDRHTYTFYKDIGIEMFKKPITIKNILFSHAKQYKIPSNMINIHGHSHSYIIKNKNYLNVGVEAMKYTPIRVKDLLKKFK